ncbi:MAG: GNAT family N-acetyltransferase [Ignavibacteria bacterium]
MKFKLDDNFSIAEKFLSENFSAPSHYPEWNLIASKTVNSEFYYFLAYYKDKLVGLCPVHILRRKILSDFYTGITNALIPYGGWIFSEEATIDLSLLPRKLLQSFNGFTLPSLAEFKVFYTNTNRYLERETTIIDLRKSIDIIWNSELDPKRAYKIRKAQRNEININCNNYFNLDEFYHIYKETYSQYNVTVLPKSYFEQLFSTRTYIKIKFLSAEKSGKLLSLLVVVYDKCYAIYLFGFTFERKLNLGQGEILQWEAIQTAKAEGCRYYDLLHTDKEKLPGIYKFKRDFSNKLYSFLCFSEKGYFYRAVRKGLNL